MQLVVPERPGILDSRPELELGSRRKHCIAVAPLQRLVVGHSKVAVTNWIEPGRNYHTRAPTGRSSMNGGSGEWRTDLEAPARCPRP